MTEVKHLTGEDDVGHVVSSLPATAVVLVVKELLVLQVQRGLAVGGKLVLVSDDDSLVVCHELKHGGELEQVGDITPRAARQCDGM